MTTRSKRRRYGSRVVSKSKAAGISPRPLKRVILGLAFLGSPAKNPVAGRVVGRPEGLLPPGDLVERRAGQVDAPVGEEAGDVPVKEREEQGGDVVAVAVGVGQEDDLAVAEPRRVVLVVHAAAECADDVGQLFVVEDLGLARLFGVQDLALQGQDRLDVAVAPLLGRAAGAVAFDDEELRLVGVGAVAVVQLAGKVEPAADRGLAPDLRRGGPAGLAGLGRLRSRGPRSRRPRSCS